MTIFSSSSAHVWVGEPLDPPSAPAGESKAPATTSNFGSLQVAFPRTDYTSPEVGGGGGAAMPIATTIRASDRDDPNTSAQICGRISKKTGWPTFLSMQSGVLEEGAEKGEFGLGGGNPLAWVEVAVVRVIRGVQQEQEAAAAAAAAGRRA